MRVVNEQALHGCHEDRRVEFLCQLGIHVRGFRSAVVAMGVYECNCPSPPGERDAMAFERGRKGEAICR
jgi:hypothetical protein